MKYISVLGSTGSIGIQTLDVISRNPELFTVCVLAANSSDELLEQQIKKYAPELAVLVDEQAAARLKRRYTGKTKILSGTEGLLAAAVYEQSDTVVTSLVGFAGLKPTIAAIKAGKTIALANKETLVVAGELIMKLAAKHGVSILPVDSEHSAIFQCLQGEQRENIRKILLTASGGPFRGKTESELRGVTVEACLKHPNWSMGRKITVDSASLANKGLEVIEAKWLYGVSYDQIQVVVHPQSVVHSMIEYVDGMVMAQLGMPDMRLPIQYALTYPQRVKSALPELNFWKMQALTFEQPDTATFKALAMAYEAGRAGGTMPCVFNAANEIAVQAFLERKISFLQIYDCIDRAMQSHEIIYVPQAEELFAVDARVRKNTLAALR